MPKHVSQRVTGRSPCEPNVSWRLLAEVSDPRGQSHTQRGVNSIAESRRATQPEMRSTELSARRDPRLVLGKERHGGNGRTGRDLSGPPTTQAWLAIDDVRVAPGSYVLQRGTPYRTGAP